MTERVPKHKYVRLSNLNRIQGTPSNFSVDMSNDIDLHVCSSMWLQMISMPHTFYNITNRNNILKVEYNGTRTVTVLEGFYSVTQLSKIIETQLNALITPDIVTIVLNINTSKLTFTFTNPNAQFLISGSTMSPFIGITQDSLPNIAVYTAPNIPNLSGPRTVFLHSKDINLGNTTLSTNRNVSAFASIPITVPYLGNIVYESLGSEIDLINLQGLKDISNIGIKVRASDGRILELGENHELIIVLKVFYQ